LEELDVRVENDGQKLGHTEIDNKKGSGEARKSTDRISKPSRGSKARERKIIN
jgi:hypothetical protein